MTHTVHGALLISGRWQGSEPTFTTTPVRGAPQQVSEASPAQIDEACAAAEQAFASYSATTSAQRAMFLRRIADHIDAFGPEITATAMDETGLPEPRLIGERGRTTGQLRLFADHIEKLDYLDQRHDAALPDRAPLPRPDLRMIQRPLGPVAVFGASNFPLAFSVAGGDTASALAAGCPVVVKGHPAHPGTSELVAEAIRVALVESGLDAGVFGLVHGASPAVGSALVRDPRIAAVGFTGSLGAGRALFDLCAARPVPIPFFGELGSINPVFVLPVAQSRRSAEIASSWAASLCMGVGQFCTNPGIVLLRDDAEADTFVQTAQESLSQVAPQDMLTPGIAAQFRAGCDTLAALPGMFTRHQGPSTERSAAPVLMESTGANFFAHPEMGEEIFGPLGVVLRCSGSDEMCAIARAMSGQLTATLQMDEADTALAQQLVPLLERKAGRILVNGFPTGVEVADAMVHGGPYPASTNFGATSVGTLAIRRFVRPVCYQNMPEALLPAV